MGKKICEICNIEIKNQIIKIEEMRMKIKMMNFEDSVLNEAPETGFLCMKCANKVYSRHAVDVYNYHKEKLLPEEFDQLLKCGEDWIPIAQAELAVTQTPIDESMKTEISTTNPISTSTKNLEKTTTADELNRLISLQHDDVKRQWNKNGVVQYKTESSAILQRMWGQQVQFIVAFDRITKEGYRLVAIDEGKSGGQSSGGFTGGVNAYFYFQKMDFVR